MKIIVTYILCLISWSALSQDTSLVCHQQDVDLSPLTSINTKFIEFSPAYYEQGLVFVVARERNRLFDPKTGQAYFDLMYADLAPDGTTGKPVSFSPNIRTQYHEGPSTFSADGSEIFFTRSGTPPSGTEKPRKRTDTKDVPLKIFHAIRGAEDWEQIKELPFSSEDYSVTHPSLSDDGRYLVFASDMPGGFGGMDLYIVERNSGEWMTPVNLGQQVNSPANDVFPYLHQDGYLFFSSDRSSGYGGLDIYVTAYSSENQFRGLQHLEFPFNSGRDDLGFIVAEDGMSGYFASDRKPTLGKDDLYRWASAQSIFCGPPVIEPVLTSKEVLITDREGNAVPIAYVWLVPMNADGPALYRDYFNTELVPDPAKEGSYHLRWGMTDTLSTHTANAVSALNGRVQINVDEKQSYAIVVQHNEYLPYVAVMPATSIPTYIRLEKAAVIPVECFTTMFTVFNAEGSILLKKAQVNLSGPCLPSSLSVPAAQDGIITTCLPAGCQLKAEVRHEGYSPYYFTFTASADSVNWTVNLNKGIDLPSPLTTGTVIVLDNIFYDFNKSAIRKSDAGELQALADILRKYPELTIELTSHTDTRGTSEYNMELSERRSESSKSYLMLLGVDGSRIITSAAGETQPRNNCTDGVPCSEEEHQYNRRTEVRITNPAQGMEVRYKQ